jgi:virulence-associated protein VapD
MASKAIIFDISLKRMQEDGLSRTEITKVYNSINQELRRAGFDERIQQSAYRTTDTEGIKAMLALINRKNEYPLFCKYKERVHWMTCDEYSDITDAFNVHPLNLELN